MAKNNGNMVPFNGEFDGSKIKGKINRRILEFILTISLTASLSGCTVNEDLDEKEMSNDQVPKKEDVLPNKEYENLTTNEEMEILDEYVRYIEKTDSSKNATLASVKDLIKEQYDKGSKKLEEYGVYEKYEEEKKEFLYSMNELINMTQEKLVQNGIVPYDAYKEDYVSTDKFLKDDKVNKSFEKLEGYMNTIDGKTGEFYKQLKIWFFGSELGKSAATEDSIYKKLLKFKDDYLTNRSTPYMTEEELQLLENTYMKYVESLLDKINKSLEKYDIQIPIYVDYEEEYSENNIEQFTENIEKVETFKLI